MNNLRVGDTVKTTKVSGAIIRFQPKTQDIIVKDDKGIVHACLHSSLVSKIEAQEE